MPDKAVNSMLFRAAKPGRAGKETIMNKQYMDPQIEIILLQAQDIVTASDDCTDTGEMLDIHG